jgi:hypothetical protein
MQLDCHSIHSFNCFSSGKEWALHFDRLYWPPIQVGALSLSIVRSAMVVLVLVPSCNHYLFVI